VRAPIFLQRASWFSLLTLALSLLPLAAQQSSVSKQSSPSSLVLKRTVRRVILDVVVADSDRKPVRGLTQQDFSVTEDDRRQQILSFDVHDLDSAFTPPSLPPLPPDTFVNVPTAPERGPLYILLLDMVNTEVTDQLWARQQLLKFMKDKPSGTRFAIFVISDGLHLIQGFTSDKNQLSAVADPDRPRAHLPRVFLNGNNSGRGDRVFMISIFTDIAQYLNGLSGRKNLMWFSGAFPMRTAPSDEDSPDLREDIKRAINAMVRSQVAIYPVDVRGVMVDDAHAPGGATAEGRGMYSDFRSGGAVAGGSTATPNASAPTARAGARPGAGTGYSLLASSYMSEDEIAHATGGHAYYSTNDLKGALAEATELGGSYYSLTYSPSNENYDGKLRSIHVELSQRGYHMEYRSSYYADDPDSPRQRARSAASQSPDQPAASRAGDSLYANMQHGAPMAHELFFRAHIHTVGTPAMGTPEQMANLAQQPAYFRARRKNRPAKPLPPVELQTYLIDYTLSARQSSPGATAERPPVMEVAAAAFDADSRMLNAIVQPTEAAAPISWGASQEKIYRVQQQLDVPMNATSIRLAVRDVSTDHVGTLEVPLPLASEPQTQAPRAASSQPSPAPDSRHAKPN
jgi:VWFA-related protein